METKKINKKNVKMIAHRGLSGIEKENTLMSFCAASNRSYYGLECDIHKTTDGRYVVIHDDDTLRVSGENWVVEKSSSIDLRKIALYNVEGTAKKDYYKIPYLEEYIEVAKRYNKKCIIEFKNHFEYDDIVEVLNIIDGLGYLDNCVFISFDKENLINIRNIKKNSQLQFLTSSLSQEVYDLCLKYNFSLDVAFNVLDKKTVDFFHKHNLEVNVWTVNEIETGEAMVELGVDYITTNILE